MERIRLAVAGALGRMGRTVLDLAATDKRFVIAAALDTKTLPHDGSMLSVGGTQIPVVKSLSGSCDVLIDFTSATGTATWLEICRQRGLAMVIGTTGHNAAQRTTVERAAAVIPLVQAANFSAGIQVIAGILGRIARELGVAYDIEIAETHHRHKIDAPSGTALALLDELLKATGRSREEHVVFGREGKTGERPAGQIGVHALRMGDVVGVHEIHFSGCGETITLRHVVQSRDTFAAGALRAAAWIVGKPPGHYSMGDVMTIAP